MKKANSDNFTPLLLLLIILAFIGVFLWQNFTPTVGLVFLGVRSQLLPLGLWVVIGFFGGWVTAGLIYMIISLGSPRKSHKVHRQAPVNDYPDTVPTPARGDVATDQRSPASQYNDQYDYQYENSPKKFSTETPTKIQRDNDFSDNLPNEKMAPESINLNKSSTVIQDNLTAEKQSSNTSPNNSPNTNFTTVFPSVAPTVVSAPDTPHIHDDWLEKPKPIGDWESNATQPTSPSMSRPTTAEAETTRQNTEFETAQSPKSESWSGSVYSYGYRDPENTGVGKTESIYDAEFRVIAPPAPAPSPSESSPLTGEVDPAISEIGEVPNKPNTNDG